jgi:hypothetical protein
MADRAQVSSVEGIEAFRAKLVLFTGKSRAVLEEVLDQVQRTRVWLETDQRSHWDSECRRFKRILEDAQQELFSARLSQLRTQSAAQILAVERAKRALAFAEDKRAAVKRWSREFELRAEPLAKEVEPLLTFVTTDLTKALAYLGSVVKALEAYAAIQTPGGTTPVQPTAPIQDAAQALDSAATDPSPAESVRGESL